MENNDDIKFLLEQKLKFVEIIANTSMTWWVSSVVFCGTIIGFAIWKLNALEELSKIFLGLLCFVIHLFFLSVVVYGLIIRNRVTHLKKDISILVNELNCESITFNNEMKGVKWALTNGTSSFVLIWVSWVIITIKFFMP